MATLCVLVASPVEYRPLSGKGALFMPGLRVVGVDSARLDRDPAYVFPDGVRMSHDAFADRVVSGEFRVGMDFSELEAV